MQSLSSLPDIRPLPTSLRLRVARGGFIFALGGVSYFLMEIVFRGYSHFSMFLCGGLCFAGIYAINTLAHGILRLLRWLLGTLLITATEFWCGVVVNIFLQWNVWDYGGQPLNLLGQVCLPFSVIWFLLCIPADLLCDVLRRLFRVELPRKY